MLNFIHGDFIKTLILFFIVIFPAFAYAADPIQSKELRLIAIDEEKGSSVAEQMLSIVYAKIGYKIIIERMPAKRA